MTQRRFSIQYDPVDPIPDEYLTAERGRTVGVASPPRPLPSSPTAEERRRFSFDHYYSKGIDPVKIAGMLGNFSTESELNPAAEGWPYRGEQAKGIAQWREPRTGALVTYAGGGIEPTNIDLATQLDFALEELETTERRAARRLDDADTVREAAGAMVFFERPEGFDGRDPSTAALWPRRVERSEAAFDELAPTSRYVFELPDGRRAWVEGQSLAQARNTLLTDVQAELGEDQEAPFMPLVGYDPGNGANRFVIESEVIEAQQEDGVTRPAVEADRLPVSEGLGVRIDPDAASEVSMKDAEREYQMFQAFERIADSALAPDSSARIVVRRFRPKARS